MPAAVSIEAHWDLAGQQGYQKWRQGFQVKGTLVGVQPSQGVSRSEPPASVTLLSVGNVQVSLNVVSSRHQCIRNIITGYYTLQVRLPFTVHLFECFWTALISPMQTVDLDSSTYTQQVLPCMVWIEVTTQVLCAVADKLYAKIAPWAVAETEIAHGEYMAYVPHSTQNLGCHFYLLVATVCCRFHQQCAKALQQLMQHNNHSNKQ